MINPYLQQTSVWSQFFLRAHTDSNHQIHKFSSHSFDAFVYQYPLIGSMVFWYIPRAFAVKKSIDEQSNTYIDEIKSLLLEIERKAREHGKVVFIKIDWNPLEIFNGVGLFLSSLGYRESNRKIQYTKTKLLSITDSYIPVNDDSMHTNNGEFIQDMCSPVSHEGIIAFWDDMQQTVQTYFDKRTRYGMRKALQHPWRIEVGSSIRNREAFISLHFETARRQQFTTFSPHYFASLCALPQSLLIVLYDDQDIPHAAWLGIFYRDTVYHLFGANDMYSREHYGQYLLHLVVIYYMMVHGFTWYDLGGIEEGKGYNTFKKGFCGDVVSFLGPYDKPIKPIWYRLYMLYRAIKHA